MTTMKLTKFWVVRNPTEHSTIDDILFETTPIKYFQYCLGATAGENLDRISQIEQENHVFFAAEDKDAAEREAHSRMRIREGILQALKQSAEIQAHK